MVMELKQGLLDHLALSKPGGGAPFHPHGGSRPHGGSCARK
jgi:hypothetical protein